MRASVQSNFFFRESISRVFRQRLWRAFLQLAKNGVANTLRIAPQTGISKAQLAVIPLTVRQIQSRGIPRALLSGAACGRDSIPVSRATKASDKPRTCGICEELERAAPQRFFLEGNDCKLTLPPNATREHDPPFASRVTGPNENIPGSQYAIAGHGLRRTGGTVSRVGAAAGLRGDGVRQYSHRYDVPARRGVPRPHPAAGGRSRG
jgi:hypothetical protein